MKRNIHKGAGVVALAFVAVCAVQLVTLANKSDTARRSVRQEWSQSSTAHAVFAEAYRQKCEDGKPIDPKTLADEPVGFAACAERLISDGTAARTGLSNSEAKTLPVAMQKALDAVPVPAPLRWM